ncbi:hypothetical protein LX32DRAFT_459528 [Colletotrichum zoysiae]|uniref:Uncharacterized protein n=1 Tax=Colletotrichum zoysiae TaxID=1216348 RepID=A0AAD9HER6_9PEZI|nr:hypothetical protein LX32DRAFT_459528 [Colletotrichum zoysiae]
MLHLVSHHLFGKRDNRIRRVPLPTNPRIKRPYRMYAHIPTHHTTLLRRVVSESLQLAFHYPSILESPIIPPSLPSPSLPTSTPSQPPFQSHTIVHNAVMSVHFPILSLSEPTSPPPRPMSFGYVTIYFIVVDFLRMVPPMIRAPVAPLPRNWQTRDSRAAHLLRFELACICEPFDMSAESEATSPPQFDLLCLGIPTH